MKSFGDAKMRLADVLDADERTELALAMFIDVIDACKASGCFDVISVVSDDSEVFWQAREHGAKPLAEPKTLSGLNHSLTFGQRYLARRVAVSELVILPADIPAVTADDIRSVVDALGEAERAAVIVPSRDNGTNALAMRPPELVPMRFGLDSADKHRAEATSAGAELIVLTNERVAFDVDSSADVDALASMPVGAATRGWLDAREHAARDGRAS
jgi:2-phospho-L-lactate/phosphoenolpyruvate guanylyltransferase